MGSHNNDTPVPNHVSLGITLILSFVMLLTGSFVHAAKGDTYALKVSSGKMRSGPAKTYPLVASVFKGDEVVELNRRSGWVNVSLKKPGVRGWIHSSLLVRKAAPAKKAKTIAKQTPKKVSPAVALARFNEAFGKLKERLKDEQGMALFGAVSLKGKGIVHIEANKSWVGSPGWQKEADLKQIFTMWRAANNGQAAAVYILDTGKSLPVAMYAIGPTGKKHIAVRE